MKMFDDVKHFKNHRIRRNAIRRGWHSSIFYIMAGKRTYQHYQNGEAMKITRAAV